ncbi:Bzip transcription factor [Phytophthora cinnamomi]|uniref:Bzip transcription factor n=1 Tax=Phytophthora cinnamomi TaxID=4785 RepID=UPI003559AC05|nr:Bzip transcription factor [Phytophthora cinnamomi]
MFPHILANEELVQVLLSREIEYPTCTTYVFNERSQVERQDLDVDFIAGINQRLGSTYATSRIMQRALISDCCKLGQVTPVELDESNDRLGLSYIMS